MLGAAARVTAAAANVLLGPPPSPVIRLDAGTACRGGLEADRRAHCDDRPSSLETESCYIIRNAVPTLRAPFVVRVDGAALAAAGADGDIAYIQAPPPAALQAKLPVEPQEP